MILPRVKSQVKAKILVKWKTLVKQNWYFNTRQVLKNQKVRQYLPVFQENLTIVPFNKISDNFAFIFKISYVTGLLTEAGIV